jgi:hypothetical protein
MSPETCRISKALFSTIALIAYPASSSIAAATAWAIDCTVIAAFVALGRRTG